MHNPITDLASSSKVRKWASWSHQTDPFDLLVFLHSATLQILEEDLQVRMKGFFVWCHKSLGEIRKAAGYKNVYLLEDILRYLSLIQCLRQSRWVSRSGWEHLSANCYTIFTLLLTTNGCQLTVTNIAENEEITIL